jgi:hypothetical protein
MTDRTLSVLGTVAESLAVRFELGGEVRPLAQFDGVVAADDRTTLRRWGAVDFVDGVGIRLEGPDGRVDTFDVDYFAARLADGTYVPAKAAPGSGQVRVATTVGATRPPE